jgi:endonuclease YncB( thermonuclease family)
MAGWSDGSDQAAGIHCRSIGRLSGEGPRPLRPLVAICRASGEDMGAILVREGFAWAFARFSIDYVDQHEEVRIANRDLHAHDCVPAWEWRAQHRAKTVQ